MIRSEHLTHRIPFSRRRVVRVLVAAPVMVAVVGVGCDQLVGVWGERAMATRIQQDHQLADRPEVTIHGVTKGWQVVSGSIDDVDVRAADVPVETTRAPLTVTTLDVAAQQVTRIDGAHWRAGSAQAQAFVSYEDLSRALGVTVERSADGKGVHLSANLPLAGQVGASAHVEVASATSIRLSALTFDRQSPPDFVRRAVHQIVDQPIQLSSIPEGMRLSSVDVRADGVRVSLVGAQVTVAA